jgi:hypothetical protein
MGLKPGKMGLVKETYNWKKSEVKVLKYHVESRGFEFNGENV